MYNGLDQYTINKFSNTYFTWNVEAMEGFDSYPSDLEGNKILI